MIYSIRCDKSSFKPVYFKKGFNVILAERTKESTIKDSRNGLGKSTLIEIIHFCLGAYRRDLSTLRKSELDDWTFILDLELDGKRYSVSRNTSNQNKIIIEGDCSNWEIKPTTDKKTKNQIISRNDWKKCLGHLMFGLQPLYDELNYVPTFRSLISYFIRRNTQRGSFLSPFRQYMAQLEWDIQVNSAFLLGLGWEYASKLQVLKDRKKILNQIKQEAQIGLIEALRGNIGELEAFKIRLDAQVKQEEEHLKSFNVHPQYSQLEKDADNLTSKIHELVNLNITDKQVFEYYEASLKEEIDAKPESIVRVYKEAGLLLPKSITKKIDEILDFHKRVVVNRKDFLTNEMERLRKEINKREQEVEDLSSKRAELMQTLQKHGALEEFNQLQSNHQHTVSKLKDISLRLDNLRKFEQGKSAILIEQEIIHQDANIDLKERELQRKTAILTFNDYSENLYEVPGTLSINFAKTGFKFGVEIERSGSEGIGKMKIFCYDLILAKLWAKKTKTPIHLIHDSTIFHGVDERQIALALKLAKSESNREGFQYICAMNSDMIPKKDLDFINFNFEPFITIKLTDATKDGGLLGIRF